MWRAERCGIRDPAGRDRAWSTKAPHLNVCAAVNAAVAIRTRALAHTTVTDVVREQPHSLCITRSVHQKVCGSDSWLAVPTVASHDSCFGLAYNDLGTYMYDLASRYEAYVTRHTYRCAAVI